MSDWQVGDLAVCVDADHDLCLLERGRIYRVTGVTSGGLSARFGFAVGLFLEGVAFPRQYTHGAAANRFRKIRPDEHEACEEEFVTLLRKSKAPAHA